MGLITTAEAAAWLNIADWATDAPELPALVEAASAAVEEFCDRRFASATVTETYAGHGSRLIFPRRAPVTGVTSITVDDVARRFRPDQSSWSPTPVATPRSPT
jgi:hypothetical protein